MDELTGTAGQRRRAAELIRLARAEFKGSLPNGRDLLPGEVKMLKGAAMGEPVSLCSNLDDAKDLTWYPPFRRDVLMGPWCNWSSHRVVRATVIKWVCCVGEACSLVDTVGLGLAYAYIDGKIDFDGASIPIRVALFCCALPWGLSAMSARVKTLILNGSSVSFLNADGVNVEGSLFLKDDFFALEAVRLVGAKIQGSLEISGGILFGRNGEALNADWAKIKSSVFFDNGFSSYASVQFIGAFVGGDFYCENNVLRPVNGKALHLQSMTLSGGFVFSPNKAEGEIDLTNARVGMLVDLLQCWPDEVRLTGFSYLAIFPESVGSVAGRLGWLAKSDEANTESDRFDPQPYRQLAKVLRLSGHDQFADSVMYEASKKSAASRIRRQRKRGALIDTVLAWVLIVLNALYIGLVGHGYKRIRPFVWMIVFVVIGGAIFSGFRFGDFLGGANPTPSAMQQTQGLAIKSAQASDIDERKWVKDYPVFRPLAYSADAFLPLVNLHQESYWTPKDSWVKSFYLPFHILAGWVVTTLAAVSVTGLVRHEKE